ncbi:hypothetical protein CMV_011267 [Castanea mollissima]|uniref:Uncharacterized protein n=1 Tax=Castanea mollissima TaxID=60419 RepID=A0A8J4RGY6_9ROSI|nr:hypothetical protein CMV_011267 [Castanea mollissima]
MEFPITKQHTSWYSLSGNHITRPTPSVVMSMSIWVQREFQVAVAKESPHGILVKGIFFSLLLSQELRAK